MSDMEQNLREVATSQRNDYIDLWRGIGAIGVIAIHTAFYAGQMYTPEWFWNLTLFLDVPLFFYLSGWASSYQKSDIVKTAKSLGMIWFKWIFFILCLSLFCWISQYLPWPFEGVHDFRELVNNFFFNVNIAGFPVVKDSVWFMEYYFVVVIINTIVIMLIQSSNRADELKKFYMLILAFAFAWASYGKYVLGLELLFFLFYSFFWMLGYNKMGKAKSKLGLMVAFLVIIGGFCICSYLQDIPLYNLQQAKFPPTLKYGFASVLIVIVMKWCESYIHTPNGMLCHIGRNAIYYYFAQGIGSTLNYYVANSIRIGNWWIKWPITFVVNVIVTIFIAEFLRLLFNSIYKYVKVCQSYIKKGF